MLVSDNLFKFSNINTRKTVSIALVLFMLTFPAFFLNSQAQSTHRLYLNRVGFLNIEVGYDVCVIENYAYVTNNDGLMIIDIQNPYNPQKVGEVLSGGALGVKVESNIAYIASVTDGFIISNVSSPSAPQLIGQDSVGGATRLVISGSHAYVTYFGGGFKIFNISDLTNPTFLGEYIDTRSDAIEIKDNFVYLANAEVGLKVVNVSIPSSPQLITIISQTGGANDIHITNDTLYLGCWGAGIRVINISDPTLPLLLDSYDDNDGGEELGLIEKDGFLYVADNYGVELFDVSNPTSIVEIAERTSDVIAAHDIDVDNEYIYVAQGGGLLILEVSLTPENENPEFFYYLIIILAGSAVILVTISIVYFKIFKPRK
ncbi:MAG: LVIVD repeat-containing protein [Candidatus Hermodarchaeota archaeon]